MFSSSHFSPEYFSEHFKVNGEIIVIEDPEGGSGSRGATLDLSSLRSLRLNKDDQEIVEFIVAFVLNH